MREREYFGESPVDLLTPDHLQERLAAGWKLVALEWERSGDEPGSEREAWVEEIPYGLQISSDRLRLVENPGETQVIVAALDMIVDDCPLSRGRRRTQSPRVQHARPKTMHQDGPVQ